MARVFLTILSAFLFAACTVPDHPAWTPGQRATASRIRKAGSLAGWITSADTIDLRLPDSVRVDVRPRVVLTPREFFLCNPLGRTVVRLSRDGSFRTRFGRSGSGPGEFRSIVSAAADTLGLLYVFDNLLARITCFSPEGAVLATFPVHSPFLVRHLCPIDLREVYVHHAPDSAGDGFVTLTGKRDRDIQLVNSPQGFPAYYFRGHLEGALVRGRAGEAFETNAYSPCITRIRSGKVTATFGGRVDGFSPLPESSGFSTIHELQKAVMNATLVKGLFLVGGGRILLQELIRFSGPSRSIDRRLMVYDTSGVRLGELAGDAGGIETSDGDALVQVLYPDWRPGRLHDVPQSRTPRLVLLHVRGYDYD